MADSINGAREESATLPEPLMRFDKRRHCDPDRPIPARASSYGSAYLMEKSVSSKSAGRPRPFESPTMFL